MPEDVLFEVERRMNRTEIATYLRTVAEKLESGEEVSLSSGEQSVTVAPPVRPAFEVKVERETAQGAASGEISVEFELEWDENGEGDASLDIE